MKSVLIGFDAFDPQVFERLLAKDRLPHLAKFIEQGSYHHLAVTNPAQSEVSWTSMATGLNPGGHGLFDFVQRNPASYGIEVSLLPTAQGALGTQFVPPHQARTLFEHAVETGYPATSLWWPATFPAKLASPVRSIPGLGTPDILGQLGVGAFFSTAPGLKQENFKSRLRELRAEGNGRFSGALPGPRRKKGGQIEESELPFRLEAGDEGAGILEIGDQRLTLKAGEWSRVFDISFKLGLLSSVRAVTRAIFSLEAEPQIYFLPLQIHPLHSPWPYATPAQMVRSAWEEAGPFLTLGWPQDTTALEEGIIGDGAFLALCDDIIASRERVFLQQLGQFEEGVLAIVFDTLDRVQHMFFKQDEGVLEAWYVKLDALFGRILQALKAGGHEDARVLIVSDHGFAPFDFKVHLNRWLMENKWMKAPSGEAQKNLSQVEWTQTRAYALGLNSLYLNLKGREGAGIVTLAELAARRAKLREELLKWRGPDKRQVLDEVWVREEVFEGEHVEKAPDLVLGYALGYRASAQTGLGGYGTAAIEENGDHWNADHCINPAAVPGVLMSSFALEDLQHPSYKDIPELVLGEAFTPSGSKPVERLSDEEQEIIEERMKGLGYL